MELRWLIEEKEEPVVSSWLSNEAPKKVITRSEPRLQYWVMPKEDDFEGFFPCGWVDVPVVIKKIEKA